MIIDFRVRPPYKGYLDTVNFRRRPVPEDPALQNIFEIGREPNPSCDEKSIELFVEEMDAVGIDKAVIMGRKADDFGNVDNDELLELSNLYPGRFISFAGINPNLPGQIEEIERTAKLGFRGVGLDAGWLRKPLLYDDPLFEPVFAKCQDLGLVASLTSSFMLGPTQTYSHPDAIQTVAMKFPKLKIVVPHACWPHVHQALALAIRCPNVYLMPDCYLYIDGFPLADEYVKAANGFLKYRTLFASSYPVRSLKQCVEGWKARGFDPDALQKTFYDNAARLLGM